MNTITETELNEAQQAVVDSNAPRRLVIAGPGSGKTRTLVAAVEREAKLHGAAGCVVITYTNNAAHELQERLATRGVTGLGFCGTLHAFLFRCVAEANNIQMSVVDDEQREALVTSIMEDLGVNVPLKHVMPALGLPVFGSNHTKVQCVALEYKMRLEQSGMIDFDTILRRGCDVASYLEATGRWPYKSLFMDEVQDSGDWDWLFCNTAPFKRKFLVGDSDQAIYGFRGAQPEMLVKLAELAGNPKTPEPKYELHVLGDNYRSGVQICNAGNWLIRHNKNRFDKDMVSASMEHNDCEVHGCKTPAAELSLVLEKCRDVWCGNGGNVGLRKTAVLARTNRLAQDFATHLSANGIPVATVEPAPRPNDWREAKLLLTVLANPWNDTAVLQLIRASEGDREAKVLREAAAVRMVGVNELLAFRYGKGDATIDADLSKHGLSMESRQRIHDACRELGHRGDWSINDLVIFLGQQDSMDRTVGDGVTCCTVHQSKGCEYDCVFIVGCEEQSFPSAKNCATPEALEESRRLMFVAMTRARHRLCLTWCEQRPGYRGPNVPAGPMERREASRFIKEAGL